MSRLHALLPVVLCLLLVGACTRDRMEGVGLGVEADPVDPAELVGPESQAEATAAAYLTYVVKVGDALASVAAQHGTTVEVIQELNPQLTSDNLLPGDEIRIPAGLAPLEQPSQPLYYVVQQGDLVVVLAERFGVTLEQIREANPLVDLDQVPVGLRIVIPVPADTEADPVPVYDGLTYSVQPGDTLNAIALRYSVEPGELVLLNNLVSADDLLIGQILRLPDHSAVSSAAMHQPELQGEGVVHVVQAGETLSEIALFYQVSTVTLMATNGLQDADTLSAGTELLVPACRHPSQRQHRNRWPRPSRLWRRHPWARTHPQSPPPRCPRMRPLRRQRPRRKGNRHSLSPPRSPNPPPHPPLSPIRYRPAIRSLPSRCVTAQRSRPFRRPTTWAVPLP